MGEMPWVGATEEPDEYVDGQKFLQQCYEYHLSTFSIEHNYRDTHRAPPNEPVYNIARWQTEELNTQGCKKSCAFLILKAGFRMKMGTPSAAPCMNTYATSSAINLLFPIWK